MLRHKLKTRFLLVSDANLLLPQGSTTYTTHLKTSMPMGTQMGASIFAIYTTWALAR